MRVIMYMALSLVPSIWFLFSWMFKMGHVNIVQNGMAPVSMSMAELSMMLIVFCMGKETEVDW